MEMNSRSTLHLDSSRKGSYVSALAKQVNLAKQENGELPKNKNKNKKQENGEKINNSW